MRHVSQSCVQQVKGKWRRRWMKQTCGFGKEVKRHVECMVKQIVKQLVKRLMKQIISEMKRQPQTCYVHRKPWIVTHLLHTSLLLCLLLFLLFLFLLLLLLSSAMMVVTWHVGWWDTSVWQSFEIWSSDAEMLAGSSIWLYHVLGFALAVWLNGYRCWLLC
jgi:hypothetical protein